MFPLQQDAAEGNDFLPRVHIQGWPGQRRPSVATFHAGVEEEHLIPLVPREVAAVQIDAVGEVDGDQATTVLVINWQPRAGLPTIAGRAQDFRRPLYLS